MATSRETADFILNKLRHPERFSAKPIFGDFCLYADGIMVAVICDDRLYVKIASASKELGEQCKKGQPYPRAKLHYFVDKGQISTIPGLPAILFGLAEAISEKKGRSSDRKS